MNDVMSVGIHRLWKDQFVRTLSPFPGSKILDVAGGTGENNHVELFCESRSTSWTIPHGVSFDGYSRNAMPIFTGYSF